MSLEPGTVLGHYEIAELIGKGGMGEVFRARDTNLGRDVALKTLPSEVVQVAERLARFRREAQVLASLNHPNIAAIHGLEEADGQPFLLMELVEGEDLSERLQRGAIPLEEAVAIALQVAEALEEAHEKGIVHRDLKPANIKVTPDGKVVVLDFGLAKAYALENDGSAAELSQSPTLSRQATAAGVILGTAAYMSPEQAKGKSVDKRTDIWAFGAVVYEMLTGRQAFSGEDFSETLAAILKEEPEWTKLPAETSAKLQELLRRCLRKDRKQRLHDVADARIELDEGLGEAVVETPPNSPTGWAGFVVAAVAGGMVAAMAVTLMRSTTPLPPLPVTRSIIPLPVGGQLGSQLDGQFESKLAISPDGLAVAYVVREGGAAGIYLRSLDSMEAKLLPETDGASMPFFSPDGRWVGFIKESSLWKISVTGGAPVELSAEASRGADWAPDGTIIFTRNGDGLERVSPDGGASETLTTPDLENREKTHRFPHALPGGKALLFTHASADIDSFDEASIALLSLETGETRILVQGGSYPHYVASGHLVYGRAGAIVAVPFALDRLEVTGPPVTVLEGVSMDPIAGNVELSVSGTGDLLYAPGGPFTPSNRVVWVDRSGTTEPLTQSTGRYSSASLAPDDSRVAMMVGGANNSIWIYDIARATSTRLVSGFENMTPIWTPSADRVTFMSDRSGIFNLYWQEADGSTPLERLTTSDVYQSPVSWSPDGQWLAFVENVDLWVMSADGERLPGPLARSSEQARFSPDGRFLAYASDETGELEVYIQPFPTTGKKWQVSTAGGSWAVWHPNGRELYFRRGSEIMVVEIGSEDELSLSIPRRLFEVPSSFRGPRDIGSDGERFVFVDSGDDAMLPTQMVLVQNWAEELKRLVPTDDP